MKVRSYGFSIILILISILGNLGFNNVNENNISEYIAEDPASVADFIEDNFEYFVSEYNKSFDGEWSASCIENRHYITINECGTEYEGVFLDFDGNNGYAVVGNDYNLLDFSAEGCSPYETITSNNYYFSPSTGYFYLMDGEYFSVNELNNTTEDFIKENYASKHYDGQEKDKTGCGKIENTDQYVKSKYGEGWTLSESHSFPMIGYSQWRLSCYKENKVQNGTISGFSEGNCWAVSAYIVLQYLADSKFVKMPQSEERVVYRPHISEPKIYSKYYNSNGNNKTKKVYADDSTWAYKYELMNPQKEYDFPKLYADVRIHANEKYQRIETGTVWETSEIIEYATNKYGYYVNAREHIFWGLYADKGTSQLDENKPLLWSTASGTYGSHTMAVCGYKYYSKTSGWWIFKTTQYKLFYELRDGHKTDPRYYDISGHIGFSTIISLDY